MYLKSDSIKIVINDESDKVIKELFDSLKNRYQNDLELMKGSEFVFDCLQLLYDKCHKINFNCGGSYIDSPGCIKNKKATIDSIYKKDNKCFQYARVNSRVKLRRNKKKILKEKQKLKLV